MSTKRLIDSPLSIIHKATATIAAKRILQEKPNEKAAAFAATECQVSASAKNTGCCTARVRDVPQNRSSTLKGPADIAPGTEHALRK